MKIKVKPTEKIQKLKEDIEKRQGNAKIEGEKVIVEAENTEFLEKIPGIEEYTYEGETKQGLKGRPLDEQAYIKIESKEDAVKAFLATMDGYNLVVLNTGREWDLRKLKEYNPDIKHVKTDKPKEMLGIEKAVGDIEGLEQIEIEFSDEEKELVYREMLS